MKRSNEGEGSSQPKRPAMASSSRLDPSMPENSMISASGQRMTSLDVKSYLERVKEAFPGNRDKYTEFLAIMRDFKSQRIDTAGVIIRVKELFKGKDYLLLGFNNFLPRGYEITLPIEDGQSQRRKPIEYSDAFGFVTRVKVRFESEEHVFRAFLDYLKAYKDEHKSVTRVYEEVSAILEDHVDLLIDFAYFLPDLSGAALVQRSQTGPNRYINVADRNTSLTMENTMQQQNFVDTEHTDGDRNVDDYEPDHSDRGTQEHRSTFCEKVKEKLQDSESYVKFLNCVRSYQAKFFSTSIFRKMMAALLEAYPDLIAECEDFIAYLERSGRLQSSWQIFRPSAESHDNRERDRYDRGFNSSNKDTLGQRMSPYVSRDQYAAKPIHELDLSNSNSCTPSYRLLPEDYPVPVVSARTKLCAEVLNDQWVSVTSGSEDYSFKHMRKNQYEESLFRCEDDRFELDMLLESVTKTAVRVEKLLEKLNSRTDMESTFRINDHLNALDIRCIERLYADHALDVTDVLTKNAPLALPVILTRLKQKQDEWVRCRADFGKIWAEVYAKNYHKSLDHRSFYFKQQDTKNLSAKALLAEIKEISENNEITDTILSIGAGYKQKKTPLEFKYPDAGIHEDLYQLIDYASGEVCTPEQHDKVMKIWTNFLETLLGIPPRPLIEEENVKDTTDTDGNNVEENVFSAGEGAVQYPVGDETDQTKNLGSIGVQMAHGNNEADNQQGTSVAEGKISTDEENASDLKNGPEFVDSNMEIGDAPSQEAQTHLKETDDAGREEGELSPGENLEASKQLVQNPHTSAPTAVEIEGKEICGDGQAEKTDTNGDEEVEESPQGSLEDENASENEDLSVSESANVEESQDAHDEDGVHNEDEKVETEGEEADHMTDADDTDAIMSDTDRFLRNVKPLNVKSPLLLPPGKEQNSQIFYANDSLYLLFRFHQMLYERMQSAKLHTTHLESTWRTSNTAIPSDSYDRFKEALYSLLDGSSDNPKFEDDCRAIIGTQSYVLFTLDKLIHKLLKQLQSIATEDVENRLIQLYAYEKSRNPEKFVEAVYHENACFVLPDDNLYRIECFPGSSMRLTIQHMKNNVDNRDPTAVLLDPDFAAYLHGNLLSVDPGKPRDGLFLKRNKKKLATGNDDDDMAKAMEGVMIHNGVEIKVNAKTMKAAYVLGTEDFFYRTKNRRLALYGTSDGSAAKVRLRKIKCTV